MRFFSCSNFVTLPSCWYGNPNQGIFEGTKAFRREDGGLFLFRPDQNAIRMQYGADRMCMPSPSINQFIDGVKQTALANRRWVISSLFFTKTYIKTCLGAFVWSF